MKKQSAGLLVYRVRQGWVEVLLVHPGGPFWAKKDLGAWSIPKGEFEADEEPLMAAYREFQEELGLEPPKGKTIDLGSFKRQDGKTIFVWATQGDLDISKITSGTFTMQWPPKSGQDQAFPEVDKAAWFDAYKAPAKLHKGQDVFITRLLEYLGMSLSDPKAKGQTTLF